MKRKFLLSSIILCLILASFFAWKGFSQNPSLISNLPVLAQQSNPDWPQVQGNANHSGYVSQTVVPPYAELWHVRYKVSSRVQPIIAQGFIFIPSNDGKLYALRTQDGSEAWSYQTQGPLVNSVGYDNGRVFFGSTDHYVYALNATNGNLIWKYQTGETIKTAPVVAQNTVYIGSSDGYFYALDALTTDSSGRLIWRYNIGAPIYDIAAYDNGKVFFGGMNAKGYALDANSGNLLWSIQTRGQGFRDRWTVAGNGKVFFTPMLQESNWEALGAGTSMFHTDASPVIYNQPWSTQRQAILNHLTTYPYQQPLYVVNQDTGQIPFTPPVLLASGGSQSPHSQVVLLPNGNANVIYRRSFGEPATSGQTTSEAIYTGELNLTSGDILPVDTCDLSGTGWADCGYYKSAFITDESATLIRSGQVIYLDIGRGTYGLDTANRLMLPAIACYNGDAGFPFYLPDCLVTFDDYVPQGPNNSGGGWRVNYSDVLMEVDSDGNDLKRPTPIVGDTFYILHYGMLVAVKGTIR